MAGQDESRLRASLEVAAVVLTGAAHLAFGALGGPLAVFIGVAGAGWLAYLGCRVHEDRGRLAAWGLRRTGLRATMLAASAFAVPAAAGMALAGGLRGTLTLSGHLALAAALYPLWGTVQQLLVQGLVTRRLVRWLGSAWTATPLVALLFAAAHAPSVPLMAATFAMGLAFTPIYVRWRNLWPLGLWHGVLGALFYVWVLGRDVWAETLG